jgi:hypothetical protein
MFSTMNKQSGPPDPKGGTVRARGIDATVEIQVGPTPQGMPIDAPLVDAVSIDAPIDAPKRRRPRPDAAGDPDINFHPAPR